MRFAGGGVGMARRFRAAGAGGLGPEPVRGLARGEVRGAGKQSVGDQVAVGIDHHGVDPLQRRAGREAPGQGAGGEGEAPGELQLARALVPRRLDGDERHAGIDRERGDESSAGLLRAEDAHRRHPLLAAEGDVDVEGAAGGLDGGGAHQRQGPELDARLGDPIVPEDGVVEPLDDRVSAPELARAAGRERQAPERHPAGERLGALAEEIGGDGIEGKIVEGPAVPHGGEDVDTALNDGIGEYRGEAKQEQHPKHHQDRSVSHARLLVQRTVGAARASRRPA